MLKDYLKERIRDLYEDGVDFYDLPYELFGPENVNEWPEISLDEDDPDEVEPLDLENFEILSIDDDSIEICCGGDSQDPMILTIELVDDELTVTDYSEGYEEGLSEDEFDEILFGDEYSSDDEGEDEDYDEDED